MSDLIERIENNMHEVLHQIVGVQKQNAKVQIAIGLCNSSIGNKQKRVVDAGELLAHHVEND